MMPMLILRKCLGKEGFEGSLAVFTEDGSTLPGVRSVQISVTPENPYWASGALDMYLDVEEIPFQPDKIMYTAYDPKTGTMRKVKSVVFEEEEDGL